MAPACPSPGSRRLRARRQPCPGAVARTRRGASIRAARRRPTGAVGDLGDDAQVFERAGGEDRRAGVVRTRPTRSSRRRRPIPASLSRRSRSPSIPRRRGTPAREVVRPQPSGFVHRLDQIPDGPRHRHPRGVRRGLAEGQGNFLVALLKLESRDDRLALLGPEAREGRLVSLEPLAPDGVLEGRGPPTSGAVARGGSGLAPS